MNTRLFAFIAFVMMMFQESSAVDVPSLTTKTVVGNVLHEQFAVYALALLMLIAVVMM